MGLFTKTKKHTHRVAKRGGNTLFSGSCPHCAKRRGGSEGHQKVTCSCGRSGRYCYAANRTDWS